MTYAKNDAAKFMKTYEEGGPTAGCQRRDFPIEGFGLVASDEGFRGHRILCSLLLRLTGYLHLERPPMTLKGSRMIGEDVDA